MIGAVSSFLVPLVIGGIIIYGLLEGVHLFDAFLKGAGEGIKTAFDILPSFLGLMLCIGMFKASGALDLITFALKPLTELLHFPPEVVPLAVLRPISGSGALVIFTDIIKNYGPDSAIGRVASVLQGCTETTFYTIAVYYGSVGVKKTRHTLASSLAGDFTAFFMSAAAVYLMFNLV